ncbi:MAG: tetratricopeptide repeat protein, partial [Bryobacteraceae bacterium]
RLTDAIEAFRQAIEINPAYAAGYNNLGQTLQRQGDWPGAINRYERAVEAATRAAKLSRGNQAAQMQEWTIVALASDQMNKQAEANSAFRRALAFNASLPQFDPVAAYEYLKVLERDHRDKEAREVTTLILQRSPEYGPAHLSRAKGFAAENKFEEAAKEAEFTLAHLDGGPVVERDAHYLLARLYLRLKQPALADAHKNWLTAHP